MARLVSWSGKVSRLTGVSTPAARPVRDREPATQALSFFIDDRPARYRGHPVVGEGDLVTVAGLESEGVLNALAIRNRSTGVDYGGSSPFLYVVCGVVAVAGLASLRLGGLGLIFLAVAAGLGYRVRRTSRALTMVRAPGATWRQEHSPE